ncbi:Putative acyl-CoA dehydrogenase FadE17 [bacterium HR24]|jgi:alkylation response protein AidB-like acyl-CoA dehydrogenase|nr:Putative acyl-CoA dehydrogenase FadE17 [bacterium HR24]
MDFRFAPEEEAFRQEVRQFIESECPPELRSGGVSFFDQLPALVQWRRKLAQRGWIAPAWPKEYGGAGMTIMQQFIYNLETARLRAPSPLFIGGLAVAVVGPTLILFGSEEQKKTYLPKILSGEHIWCQGFSEPNAGSDLASLQTTAVRDGDEYVINGQKIWTTLAHMAHYMLLLCRTDPNAPKHKGLSYLIVPMKDEKGNPYPGITVQPLYNMAGTHEFNQVFFENVRVPAKNLVGEENQGWYMAVRTLDIERSNIGSAVGQQQSVEDLARFVQEARGSGQERVSHLPSLRYELAERWVETEISLLLSYRVVTMQNRGIIPNYEASATKLFSMELNQRIANTGMKVLGLYGQLARSQKWAPLRGRIEFMYLRSVANTIEGGTSEIQRNVIAGRGLGLPRD